MIEFDSETLNAYSQELAFCGNSLLDTVHHTGDTGLLHEFWDVFPTFGDEPLAEAAAACKAFADDAERREEAGEDLATEVSVEFTKLFVGPPRPAAAPWETFYRGGGDRQDGPKVGFGEATFEMRQQLRDAGLELSNENNQYADHMGIELLFASIYADRASKGDEASAESLKSFVAAHPLKWIGAFRAAVDAAAPGGYYSRIVALAEALLNLAR